jgi:hypothetical protein
MDWTPLITPLIGSAVGDQPSYVLPIQDAGLQTYLRSLDIRFAVGTHSLKAVA